MKRFMGVALVCLLLLSVSIGAVNFISGEGEGSGLADSPWPCSGHDRRNTGRSPYDTSHVDGTVKWSFSTKNYWVSSAPAIGSDGTIYFGSNDGNLYAVNPDGTEEWNFSTRGDEITSPAIGSDGTIYFGSNDGNLYAVNPDGTEKWNFFLRDFVTSPTIGSDGTIYFGSEEGNLYALHSEQTGGEPGTEKWNFSTGAYIGSSPAISSDGTIYFGSSDGNLYAVNPDGTEKWNFSKTWKVNSGPVIDSNGTVYFVGDTPAKRILSLYAVKPDGTEKWNFSLEYYSDYDSGPAIGKDGTIYIGSANEKLYAINPNGSVRWRFPLKYYINNPPSIGGDGTIYIGSWEVSNKIPLSEEKQESRFYAINPDGTEKWNISKPTIFSFALAIGSDGTIYMSSEKLYAIGAPSSDEPSLTVYQMVILAVAIITVISIVYWKKRGSGRNDIKAEEESKGQTEDTLE